MDDSGQPLLANFGLSKVSWKKKTPSAFDLIIISQQILDDITDVPKLEGVSHPYRWFAPELCCTPGVISTYSDVYAFGMTVIEVRTTSTRFESCAQ